MIPYLRLWLYGAAVAVILGGVGYYGHTRYQAGKRAGDAALLAYQSEAFTRLIAAQEAAREAIRQSQAKALADADKARRVAEQGTQTWKRRYQEALQQPACSVWQSQAVRCPVPPST